MTETAEVAAEPPKVSAKEPVDWKSELKGIALLVLAVLGFHSLVAKPFYIPSESMMPGLLIGDRLVVTKFTYGWSYVSPSIPSVDALFRRIVLRQRDIDSYTVRLPFIKGRLFGSLPERGDVVIVVPNGSAEDYIKRVIALPGDRFEVRNGQVILNNVPIKRAAVVQRMIPVDTNSACPESEYPGLKVAGKDGKFFCQMPVVRETLPNGVSYDTIDLGYRFDADDFPAITIPDGKVFLMGDNRDRSADSRFAREERGLGGPVPYENIGGRAEFITFSLDGTADWWNPISWISALRSGRAGGSLRPDQEP